MPDEPDETQALPPHDGPDGSAGTGWLLAGRYRILGRIGRGGMADVFRAHDESLNRDVAVKLFRSSVAEPGDAASAGRQSLELQSLARLNHPNLITLYDGSMPASGPSYLVMELVDGQDLADRLEHGPLTAAQVRSLGAQMADALAYVHSQGLAHRDVKPANILLGEDGRARLSDFGIVRLIGTPRMTSADLTVGTAAYVAPEQARGGDVGAPADVYSLGLVLIESLTGQRCFDGPMLEAMAARLNRGPHIPDDLPPPWPQLLTAMTAMDPAQRPTAAQVGETLRAGSTTQGLTAIVPSGADPAAATTSYLPAAAVAGGTRAMPAVPPVAPVPPPVVPVPPPERDGPSPWRAVLLTLGLLAVLALAGVLIYTVTSGSDDGGGGGNSPAPQTSSSTRPSTTASSSAAQRTRTRTKTVEATPTEQPTPTSQPTQPTHQTKPPKTKPGKPSTKTKPGSGPKTKPASSASSSSTGAANEGPAGPGGPAGNPKPGGPAARSSTSPGAPG